jgi:hypothetical protein
MRRSTNSFGVGHRCRPQTKCWIRPARMIRKLKPKQPVFNPKTGCLGLAGAVR